MPNEPDISELIARAKAGDDAAIREFLTRFEPEVRIIGETSLGSAVDAGHDVGTTAAPEANGGRR